ncbi:uncharacterized protein LOC110184306 [Drosophila serrata]|uniref:uncharacterized protein LOC110184306 n=1 Tax=Drosophila serrata TaxID=7274 RepID=UPI000A1D18B3|nr:uncharacterized protein LOC110184306 [Drosophila serrata]
MMILLGAKLLLLGIIGVQGYPLDEKDLSSGILHSAGLLGNYAGGLTGGEALSKLDFSSSASQEFGGESPDHLGSLGDHLSEEGFPTDFGSSSDAGEEFSEASEVHSHYEDAGDHEEHKAVPGIDHGKGAFSYSTLYEFKDRDEHELQHIQHQALEQQVEHQILEHQHHDLSHLEHLY